MKATQDQIKCNFCGRFVALKDLEDGSARVIFISDDTEFTAEEYETKCKRCNADKSVMKPTPNKWSER